MVAIPSPLVDQLVVGVVLVVASVTDLRRREVPLGLSLAFVLSGLILGILREPEGWTAAVLGLAAGALPVLPFVVLGGLGGADLLLLGAVGAWEGWHLVLRAEFWMALAGAVLALVAHSRHQGSIPYVPAILIGTMLAFLVA